MRTWFVPVLAVLAVAGMAQADKVEVKGVHLCCPMCVKGVGGALGKVDGVSDAKCDQGGKTVTFTAKDGKAAEAGVKALYAAGYFGTPTADGKELKVEVSSPKKDEKADEVTVKGVHVCCKQCQTILGDLFKDVKISYDGKGAMKDVKISGKGLEKAGVLDTLRKAGFNGKID